MTDKPTPPSAWDEEMRGYLNALRESGVVNMFCSGGYLEREFKLHRRDARDCLHYWMKTFRGDPKC